MDTQLVGFSSAKWFLVYYDPITCSETTVSLSVKSNAENDILSAAQVAYHDKCDIVGKRRITNTRLIREIPLNGELTG